MPRSLPIVVCSLASVAVAVPAALGQMTLVSQDRSITALSSFDAVPRTVTAPNFDPFIATTQSTATFTTPAGDIGVQTVATTINCFADPNRITAAGQLTAAGGLASIGGVPTALMGDAKAAVMIFFDVLVPTPFLLTAAARPNINPGDEYRLRLFDETRNDRLFQLRENDAAQAVNFSGILQPGSYSIEFRVELSSDSANFTSVYGFGLFVPSPQAAVLFGVAGLFSARRRR